MRPLFPMLSLAAALLAGTAALAQTGTPPAMPTPTQTPATPTPGGGGLLRADGDGDGVVTRAEAIAQADRQFDRLDANHDGTLAPDERSAMRDRPGRAAAPEAMTRDAWRARALARFDRIDTNRDGRIDAAEMAAMRQRMMERRGDFGPAPTPAPTPTPR